MLVTTIAHHHYTGTKKGGQALLGGLDCYVQRNFFGAQINSFETQLPAPPCLPGVEAGPFRAVFIRAPAVLETGPDVEVLAQYKLTDAEREAGGGHDAVAVAVRSGVLLATAFHPELTSDLRWYVGDYWGRCGNAIRMSDRHQLFANMVRQHAAGVSADAGLVTDADDHRKPGDLPVYEADVRGIA